MSPFSNPINKEAFLMSIQEHDIKTVLELGIGFGNIGVFLKRYQPELQIDGIEIWHKYKHPNWGVYNRIWVNDVRDVFKTYGTLNGLWQYDCVLIPDILEHFEKNEAIAIWSFIEKNLAMKLILLSIPIIYYPQGPVFDNPHEEHKSQWTEQEIKDTFGCKLMFKDKQVGVFEKIIDVKVQA